MANFFYDAKPAPIDAERPFTKYMRQGGTLQRLEHEHDIECDGGNDDDFDDNDGINPQYDTTEPGYKDNQVRCEWKCICCWFCG